MTVMMDTKFKSVGHADQYFGCRSETTINARACKLLAVEEDPCLSSETHRPPDYHSISQSQYTAYDSEIEDVKIPRDSTTTARKYWSVGCRNFGSPPTLVDWQSVRSIITRLYRDEHRSLKYVREVMEARYRFFATDNMYKTRLTAWGLAKNHKLRDVETILWIQASHASPLLSFFVSGQKVDMQDVIRYQRRRKLRTSDAVRRIESGLTIPSPDVSYTITSPSQSRHHCSTELLRVERLLDSLKSLLEGSIRVQICMLHELGLAWGPSGPGFQSSNAKTKVVKTEFHVLLWEGAKYLQKGNPTAAFTYLRQAFLRLEKLLEFSDPDVWTTFLKACSDLCKAGCYIEVGLLLDHLQKMARWRLKSGRPHTELVKSLCELEPSLLGDACLRVFEMMAKHVTLLSNNNSKSTWAYRYDLATELILQGGQVCTAGLPTLQETETIFGIRTWHHEWLRAYLASVFPRRCKSQCHACMSLFSDVGASNSHPAPDSWSVAVEARQTFRMNEMKPKTYFRNLDLDELCYLVAVAQSHMQKALYAEALQAYVTVWEIQQRYISHNNGELLMQTEKHRILSNLIWLTMKSPIANGDMSWLHLRDEIESKWSLAAD